MNARIRRDAHEAAYEEAVAVTDGMDERLADALAVMFKGRTGWFRDLQTILESAALERMEEGTRD